MPARGVGNGKSYAGDDAQIHTALHNFTQLSPSLPVLNLLQETALRTLLPTGLSPQALWAFSLHRCRGSTATVPTGKVVV